MPKMRGFDVTVGEYGERGVIDPLDETARRNFLEPVEGTRTNLAPLWDRRLRRQDLHAGLREHYLKKRFPNGDRVFFETLAEAQRVTGYTRPEDVEGQTYKKCRICGAKCRLDDDAVELPPDIGKALDVSEAMHMLQSHKNRGVFYIEESVLQKALMIRRGG